MCWPRIRTSTFKEGVPTNWWVKTYLPIDNTFHCQKCSSGILRVEDVYSSSESLSIIDLPSPTSESLPIDMSSPNTSFSDYSNISLTLQDMEDRKEGDRLMDITSIKHA